MGLIESRVKVNERKASAWENGMAIRRLLMAIGLIFVPCIVTSALTSIGQQAQKTVRESSAQRMRAQETSAALIVAATPVEHIFGSPVVKNGIVVMVTPTFTPVNMIGNKKFGDDFGKKFGVTAVATPNSDAVPTPLGFITPSAVAPISTPNP